MALERNLIMKKIAFTGDLGFSSKYFRGTYNNEGLLDKKIIDYLSNTDYTVVNVEGCVGTGNSTAAKPLVHANPPECLDFLKKINGNIWALANNHITDCGRDGVESTLDIAAQNGVQTVGIGLNMEQAEKPIIIENAGADIGIIAVTQEETEQATEKTEGCVLWDNNKKISGMIADVKTRCRWCIIVVHSGPEFCQLMPPTVRKQYKKYLKMGADIVIGHHPHVVENYEKIGDKIIFYSLGNFIFDTDYQRLQKYTEYGVFVKFYFGENTFTWDYKSMKIDRETQTIHHCKAPDIFTNVTAGQYALLWPLAMRNLYKNEYYKWTYLYPEFKDYSKWQWFKFYLRHRKVSARNRGIISGNIMYCLQLWRFGNKKLINYIKKGRYD